MMSVEEPGSDAEPWNGSLRKISRMINRRIRSGSISLFLLAGGLFVS